MVWFTDNRRLQDCGDEAPQPMPAPIKDQILSKVLDRLNAEIARLGVTQPQMAADTGLAQPEISAILRGKRPKVTMEVLHALAQCVGRTLPELLLSGELPPQQWPADVLRVALALRALPKNDPTRLLVARLVRATALAQAHTKRLTS
jgi:transcriptional regulator with XRE-family HTH domain